MLYAFCESHGVPHRRCGKLIVATDAIEQAKIEGIYSRASPMVSKACRFWQRLRRTPLEPHLSCVAAVLSEQTGIVDSHALMLALQGDFESAGGVIAFRAPVERIARGAEAGRRQRAARILWCFRSTQW